VPVMNPKSTGPHTNAVTAPILAILTKSATKRGPIRGGGMFFVKLVACPNGADTVAEAVAGGTVDCAGPIGIAGDGAV